MLPVAHVAAVMGTPLEEHDKLLRVFHGQSAEHQLIHQGEDSGVGSDAKGEEKDGDGREHRSATHGADSETQIRHNPEQDNLHAWNTDEAASGYQEKT